MKKVLLANFPVNIGHFEEFIGTVLRLARSNTSSYVCVANAHMVAEAYCRPSFRSEVIENATLVTPDGMSLVFGMRLLHGIIQPRVCGMDLIACLFREAAREKLPVFLFGSTDMVLKKVCDQALQQNPSLNIVGACSPPFGPIKSEEMVKYVDKINNSGACLILVALGCPKQERWMRSCLGKVQATMIGLGGSFEVYAGLRKRAPKWMQRIALEWLYRFLQEPRRLWKRYLLTNFIFIWLVGLDLFRKAFANKRF